MQTSNAYLNLTKLHGVCDTYIENCYGKKKEYGNPSVLVTWFYNKQRGINVKRSKVKSLVAKEA
ncbi:hypothetical protein ACQKNB_10730 [Lysinibacillus xylanilyticus]|uniref:hypothetical protein n=1 Tax=Lysinibacillus xylanilyticus TaxID=582475 RepID=UPI003D0038E0